MFILKGLGAGIWGKKTKHREDNKNPEVQVTVIKSEFLGMGCYIRTGFIKFQCNQQETPANNTAKCFLFF
jgi:hypothetical protein